MMPNRFRLVPDRTHEYRTVQSLLGQVRCDHERLTELLRNRHTAAEKNPDATGLREEISEAIGLLKTSWNGLQEATQRKHCIENTIVSDLATLRTAVREMFEYLVT